VDRPLRCALIGAEFEENLALRSLAGSLAEAGIALLFGLLAVSCAAPEPPPAPGAPAMQTLDSVLRARRSIRRFQPAPVPREVLEPVLSAAISGPSAGNRQGFRIQVVRDAFIRNRLRDAALGQASVGTAPVVLVFSADGPASAAKYGDRGADLYAVQDATIACTIAWLKAVDSGLSGVWIGAFDERAVAEILGLSAGVRPVALLPLGYADESPGSKTSRPRSELVSGE
jgi:nitroreductase